MSTQIPARSLVALAFGLLALVTGPLLLRFVPAPSTASMAEWVLPGKNASAPIVPADLRLDAPPDTNTQSATVQTAQRTLYFQRFAYSARRMDADLVPWFPDLWGRRWIRMSQRVVKGSAEVNVVSLENAYGSAAVVLAYTLRVGPYVSARFNVAKVLQIPAKLGGHNVFEIVAVSARCNKDCDEAADAAVNLLQEAIATNIR